MDGLSVLSAFSADSAAAAYQSGNAHGWLVKSSQAAVNTHCLSGRLYVAKSGWLLLSVPNALVRGVFDALNAPGVELPLAGAMNVPNVDKDLLNAHISVMTAAEVDAIGAKNINERGHAFRYTLGPVKEVPVSNIDGVSKVWFIQVSSPELAALRKTYGLTPALKNDEPFHITVAVRRRNVMRENDVSKCYETSAEKASGHRFSNTDVSYDCNCSGRCTCPANCICKKSGYCGLKTAHKKSAGELLHGGEADNVPDRQFPPKALAEGKAHEREHTDNNQIAGEIAKDHLQEDPAYYKKVEQVEKEAMPEIIKKLREAKAHSDAKRYDRKNAILRELMNKAPEEWHVDDPVPYHMGITHAPTKFRFHADPQIIPTGVKVKAAEVNPYWAQLMNTTPVIDRNKTLWQNFFSHLQRVKSRGDVTADMQQNNEAWRAELIPGYRERMNMAIARGQYPKQNPVTSAIRNYGDSVLNRLA
jgi:hypothetical protein